MDYYPFLPSTNTMVLLGRPSATNKINWLCMGLPILAPLLRIFSGFRCVSAAPLATPCPVTTRDLTPAVSQTRRRPSRPNARATLLPGELDAAPAALAVFAAPRHNRVARTLSGLGRGASPPARGPALGRLYPLGRNIPGGSGGAGPSSSPSSPTMTAHVVCQHTHGLMLGPCRTGVMV